MSRDPRFDRLRADTFAALRPPPRLDLADWIEAHVRLPGAISATPGRMTLWPTQRAVAASIGDPGVERVSVLKSARVGYTQLLVAAIGASVANNPGPTLVVVPAEQDARHLMTQAIEPTFAESPALRDALAADTSGRDVLLQRNFPGGSLSVVSARAPRNLRARTARDLFLDEVDGFEVDVRGEGDPVALAEKRTFSYGDRKIVMGSTPVDEETSRILAAWNRSDRRIYECPCPHCGDFHEIAWKDIHWQPERPETAAWACPSCGALTEDRDKPRMVAAGRWRALRPDVQGHHGYRINALVSLLPNATWPKLAAEFLEAKRSPEVLKAFTTTVLAEPWRSAGEELDESDLAARAEPFDLDRLPPEVLVLTAGVDVQHDRLEVVTLGHTREETLVLDQRALLGAGEQLGCALGRAGPVPRSALAAPGGRHPADGRLRDRRGRRRHDGHGSDVRPRPPCPAGGRDQGCRRQSSRDPRFCHERAAVVHRRNRRAEGEPGRAAAPRPFGPLR